MKLTSLKAELATEFIDIEKAAATAEVNWEPFQIELLNLGNLRLASWLKTRQAGKSFSFALDAVTDSIITPGNPHIFVSLNLSEAQEKIRYSRAIIEAIDEPMRPIITAESSTKIEFADGSRIMSHPCTEPRGKPRARIYLDEMAHYKRGLDRSIYTAALPATTRGDGYIRIASSPLGASGMFWEIHTQALKKYPSFFRRNLPWWTVNALCRDVRTAVVTAPDMETAERVERFAKPAIQEIFENMILEDFMQEYECYWAEESTAWISWEMLEGIKDPQLTFWHYKNPDDALQGIVEIKEAINKGEIEPALLGGVDIGRYKHLTEFATCGITTTDQLPLRILVSLKNCEYELQERILETYVSELPYLKMLIDENGIGSQLAEHMSKTGRAEGMKFTNTTKELLAVEARIMTERKQCPIPILADLSYQIHSIKKKVTAAGNNVFDTEKNEAHHADIFWAWALALWGGHKKGKGVSEIVPGYDPIAGMEEAY